MPEGYIFEDFSVGQTFRSGSYRMERDAIVAFAREFDPQPQHLDEDAAAASQFGRLVASGWHTAAVSMRLFIADALPAIKGGGQGVAMDGLAWPTAVEPGDDLHVTCEILAARASKSRPGKGLITVRVTTANQRGAVVQTVIHTVMVPSSTPG